jgi:hypothetical protein
MGAQIYIAGPKWIPEEDLISFLDRMIALHTANLRAYWNPKAKLEKEAQLLKNAEEAKAEVLRIEKELYGKG